LPREGESIAHHLGRKYGLSAEQLRENSQTLVRRAADVGFIIDLDKRTHIYNTFDAHRLLHWAGELDADAQLALKLALLRAYHSEGRDISDPAVLQEIAVEAGLDADAAAQVLASSRYAEEVRAQERFFQERGIRSVPAIIFNGQYLISGGQPPEAFENALRQLAARA
jgi:predicted DsbA family dithiol-disulfide isomerase